MASHTSRFAAHLVALGAGALTAVSALAFAPPDASWITLGLGSLTLVSGLAAFAVPAQGGAARCTEVLLVVAGAWTIVACRSLAGSGAVKWTDFADGVLLWALGCLGLIAHEVLLERQLGRLIRDQRRLRELTHPTASAPVREEVMR